MKGEITKIWIDECIEMTAEQWALLKERKIKMDVFIEAPINSRKLGDEWKTTGNCANCRRQNYCTKDCTANKKAKKKLAEQAAKAKTEKGVDINGATY